MLYDELRQLARDRMAGEPPGHTLQATDLVHEAYLRLLGDGEPEWNGRGHFFGAAAEAMRRILIDRARERMALKRGGGRKRVAVDDVDIVGPEPDDERLVALDDALRRMEKDDPQRSELVKLRYYAGLTVEQAAAVLGISEATAYRRWEFARAWLCREIAQPSDD